jgi:metallothionein
MSGLSQEILQVEETPSSASGVTLSTQSQSLVTAAEFLKARRPSMTGTKKCAHPACSCIAPDKQKYCSQICQDSKNVTALACHCDHPGCRG